jgi:hypothetical protein
MGKAKKTLFLVVVFFMACTSTYGKEANPNPDEWRFELTLYGFLSSMDLVSTVDGIDTPVDLSFLDILDAFDVLAAAGRLEAWKGKWVFIIDAYWVSLEVDAELKPFKRLDLTIDADVNGKIFDLDLALGYRVWEPALRKGHRMPSLFFDVMVGGRYMYVKQEVELDATLLVKRRLFQRLLGAKKLTRSVTLGGSHDWVEPFVGARVGIRLFEWLSFEARGDIGGFGIGSASDLTWNLYGIFDVKPWEHVSFKLGYRYWNIDYEHGGGSREFGMTGEMFGPWIGLTIHF